MKNKVILGTASLVIGLGACTNGNFEKHLDCCCDNRWTAKEGESDSSFSPFKEEQRHENTWHRIKLTAKDGSKKSIRIIYSKESNDRAVRCIFIKGKDLDPKKNYETSWRDLFKWALLDGGSKKPKISEVEKGEANMTLISTGTKGKYRVYCKNNNNAHIRSDKVQVYSEL